MYGERSDTVTALETQLGPLIDDFFTEEPPSHDRHHMERVKQLAEKLAAKENARRDIVVAAALLHDIGRDREKQGLIEDHAEWGAQKARDILEEHGHTDRFIEEVQHCIRAHRYSRGLEPRTIEAKIVSDADNLDALGALGIARTFSYGGENSIAIAAHESGQESGLKHIQERTMGLKKKMYTESGREIAEERIEFVEQFTERLEKELSETDNRIQ